MTGLIDHGSQSNNEPKKFATREEFEKAKAKAAKELMPEFEAINAQFSPEERNRINSQFAKTQRIVINPNREESKSD